MLLVLVTVVPLTVHWYVIDTVSPSTSLVAPGVQVSVSLVLGVDGVTTAPPMVGAVLSTVTLALVTARPESVPSVGVASHRILSDFE